MTVGVLWPRSSLLSKHVSHVRSQYFLVARDWFVLNNSVSGPMSRIGFFVVVTRFKIYCQKKNILQYILICK